MNEKWKIGLKIFLPVLFIAYLAGIITFTHVHIENGVTIVHSHPYKENGEKHHHSGAELQLLHQVSTILLAGTIAFTFTFQIVRIFLSTLITSLAGFVRCLFYKGIYQLRAPPFIVWFFLFFFNSGSDIS